MTTNTTDEFIASIPTIELSVDEWFDKFKPRVNHLNPDASWGTEEDNSGTLFETYGDEHAYVCDHNLKRQVWTWCDGDEGTVITNGYSFVNRIGYFVCEVPYDDDVFYYIEVDKYDDDQFED